ncbi:MAG: type I 3-dehydroquinate dehydratase [bacterium]
MKIGDVELGRIPVVVGIVSDELKMPVNDVDKIDVLEIRIDLFEEQKLPQIGNIINSIKNTCKKPLIATTRSAAEGGQSQIDDDRRYEIFRSVASVIDAIDVELASSDLIKKVVPLCKENDLLLIASYHNFNETPDEKSLERLLQRKKQIGANILKIAAKAVSKDDVINLLMFTIRNRNEGLITISLGNQGLMSRIINPIYGSLMTYGFLDKEIPLGAQISAFDIIKYLCEFDPEYKKKYGTL